VLVPVFVAAEFLAPVLLALFGGPAFADGAPILRLMLLSTYLAVIQVPAVNALASAAGRRSWVPAASAVSGCLLGLAVVAVLGPRLGGTGVAVGYLVGSAVTASVPLAVVWHSHRMRWAAVFTRSLCLVGATFAGATVVEAMAPVTTTTTTGGGAPGGTAPRVAIGAVALVATLAVLGGDLRRIAVRARRQPSDAPPRTPVASR
jgi:O-antigen/teichoic acid export membrane protein